MGDAGIQQTLPQAPLPTSPAPSHPTQAEPREIHVLVTGFGPFKSFTQNPSYLIASALPETLTPAPPPPPPPPPPAHPPTSGSRQLVPPPPARGSITSLFSRHVPPQVRSQSQTPLQTSQPLRPPNHEPYKIYIHTYPSDVRVAYTPTSVLIPSLLNPATNASSFPGYPSGIAFDYVFHIGLASGRESYTLETIAHREDYTIPDIDEDVGSLPSSIWRREGVPKSLDVGWDGADVLWRWAAEVERREKEALNSHHVDSTSADSRERIKLPATGGSIGDAQNGTGMRTWMIQHGVLQYTSSASASSRVGSNPDVGSGGKNANCAVPRKAVVKLSRDAGRFLCEFILMCSLVYRWKQTHPTTKDSPPTTTTNHHHPSQSQLGKVIFLHVPNGTEPADVARGVMVAESALRAVVASWEAGWRNPNVYPEVLPGQLDVATTGAATAGAAVDVDIKEEAFEQKGTGDEIPRVKSA